MINDFVVLVICSAIILLSIVGSITVYNLEQNNHKSKNIEHAIAKGIDPLSVRCSYANSQDMICIAYAASRK
jgi:hypothetical protein